MFSKRHTWEAGGDRGMGVDSPVKKSRVGAGEEGTTRMRMWLNKAKGREKDPWDAEVEALLRKECQGCGWTTDY